MAESPTHRFGQIIGEVLEMTVEPFLRAFAEKHNLFLDKKGSRPARLGAKVTWVDNTGNKHDLDFVMERGGSPRKIGVPVAFIETAWRRYTKHSRNKAQEIHGAIIPLRETYQRAFPFIGAVLAGVFTEGAITQLKSHGFAVAYFTYESVVAAFTVVGIDASSDVGTLDADVAKKCRQWDGLSAADKAKVPGELARRNVAEIAAFTEALTAVITRTVKSVRIIPLHGQACDLGSVDDAIAFIEAYEEDGVRLPIIRYEVQILYVNGNKIVGEFNAKAEAVEFLTSYRVPAE